MDESTLKPYQLCCIGHITTDRVVTPDTNKLLPGGTAFYFSHAVACLPVSYKLITAVAKEDFATVTELIDREIEVQVLPSTHTVFFENRYGANPDDRVQKVLRQAEPFTTNQLPQVNAEIIHLGPLLPDDFDAAIIQQLARRSKLSLDVQGFLRTVKDCKVVATDWDEKKTLLPFIYFLKASDHEAKVLTGCDELQQAAKLLSDWGVEEVIITMGSKGSMIYKEDVFSHIPAFVPENLVDVTGCGDTYMAGYLAKRVLGSSIQEAGEFAAALATKNLEASGPFKGYVQDVEAIINQKKIANAS